MNDRRQFLQFASAGAVAAAAPATVLAQAAAPAPAARPAVPPPTQVDVDRTFEVANIDYLEAMARGVWGEGVHASIADGAGEQWTLRENRRAFEDHRFIARRLTGTSADGIDTKTELLGLALPHPLIVAPMGSQRLGHPQGEVATVRGAAAAGALFTQSGAASRSLEDVAAAANNPKWFQVYLHPDLGVSREQLQRAKAAGYRGIVFTVDALGMGLSDAYIHLGRPRPKLPYGNYGNTPVAFKRDLGWPDLDFIVAHAGGLPVIVKGITRREDALEALRRGAAAIQVSNHGGRSLDGTPATLTVLPEIVEAVGGRAPIIFDSGIRRGTDIAKALALGANAVAIGRPVYYGLAAGGPGGVSSVLDFLRRDLINTMLHLGTPRIADLTPAVLRQAA